MFATYQEWLDEVADWIDVDDSDVAAKAARFLYLAEEDLNRRLRLREMLRCASTTINDKGFVYLPGDYGQMKAVNVDGVSGALEVVTSDDYYELPTTGALPCHYMITGEGIYPRPYAPGRGIHINYYRRVKHLSEAVPETIFTQYAPELLLIGARVQGYQYIFEEERLGPAIALLDQKIEQANLDAVRGLFGSSPLKVRYGSHG